MPSVVLAAAVLAGAACGTGSGGDVNVRPSEPAQPPAGSNARTINYECAKSSGNTILVELRNLDELADLVNGINPCEFDGGLDEITVEAPCPQGMRTITVVALENKLTDGAVNDACDKA